MVWHERDLNRNTLNPVEPGTKRSFSSIFHDPGQPQVEITFLDPDRVQISVPGITIATVSDQPLERMVERQSFALKYQRPEGEENIFYEAVYTSSEVSEEDRQMDEVVDSFVEELRAKAGLAPKIKTAIGELKGLIVGSYPTAKFRFTYTLDDSLGVHLVPIVDVEDEEEIYDAYGDKLLDIQIEQRLPIYVFPEKPKSQDLT